MIWKRWTKEYLAQNQTRNEKSKIKQKILPVGVLVCMVEDDTKRSDYQMAHSLEIQPGKDDIVRSVNVKTAKNTCKRPVVKLAPILSNDGFLAKNRAGHVGAHD